jgi:hypothetical protein
VSIEPSPSGRSKGLIHKTRKYGVLMEDARIGPAAGWDVYDVRLPDGSETSAYGFDMRVASSTLLRDASKTSKSGKRSHATKTSHLGKRSKMSHATMKPEESPRLLARWESRSGKHWVELTQHDSVTIANAMDPTSVGGREFTWYGYTSPGSSGSLAASTSAAAIAEMEQRVKRGDFLPDAAKTPMKRVR